MNAMQLYCIATQLYYYVCVEANVTKLTFACVLDVGNYAENTHKVTPTLRGNSLIGGIADDKVR